MSWAVETPSGVEIVARFRVPGEPVAWERVKRGRNGAAYKPLRTASHQDRVAWEFRRANRGWTPDDTSTYGVAALFVYKRRTNRDADNLLKLVKDGLTGVAYGDDGQVTQSLPTKVWDPDGEPYTEVVLYRTDHPRPVPKTRRPSRGS